MLNEDIRVFYDQSKTTINLNLSIENDIEVDHDGVCQLVTLLFNDFDDNPYETRVRFEDVIDNLIDFYREGSNSEGGASQLYSIANEFDRYATELRDIAETLADYGFRQLDLFDNDDD